MRSTARRSPRVARRTGRPGRGRTTTGGYYGAFVLDPDGNNVEAVSHQPE